jgi:predicted nucleic acid-binding protein
MTPRRPSDSLAVDANIILSSVLGARTRDHLRAVAALRSLITTEETVAQIKLVLERLGIESDEALHVVERHLRLIILAPKSSCASRLTAAKAALGDAPASRNGSTDDAHLLAAAWLHDADIWSHDRDFAGSGWPSWSSANLRAALSAEAAN